MRKKSRVNILLSLFGMIHFGILLEYPEWQLVRILSGIGLGTILCYGLGIRLLYKKKNGHVLGIKPQIFQYNKDPFHSVLQAHCAHPSVLPPHLNRIQFLILSNGNSAFILSLPPKKGVLIWIPWYRAPRRKAMQSWVWSHPLHACVVNEEGIIQWFSRSLLQWLSIHSAMLYKQHFSVLFHTTPPSWENIKNRHIVLLIGSGKEARSARIRMDHLPQHPRHSMFYFFPCEYMYAYENDLLFLNAIPCSAALLDSHGIIRSANEQFQEKFFLSNSNVTLGTTISCLSPQSKAKLFSELQNARKRIQNSSMFMVQLEPKYSELGGDHMFAFLQPFSSYDDRVLFIVLMMSLPQTFSPQEQLSQRMELLGQVASGIVHDFNNLLTGMIGFCDLLLQRHCPEDPSFQDVQQIKNSAVRAARLIQHLLDFSKSIPSTERVFSLQGCVQNLMPLIQRIIGPKIFLNFYHGVQSSTIYGNLDVIEQMILNLAINARDAMPNGGSLDFVLQTVIANEPKSLTQGILDTGHYLCLEVKDTGVGIPSDILPHIFDPFFSSKEHGTGLGLANIAKTIKELKGGIHVHTVKDRGSTFSVYLPLHKGEVSSKKPKITQPIIATDTAEGKILLVEDEDPIRLFSSRVLREKGYEVIEARDGIQALQIIKTHENIVLIITDVMMPGIDGPSLISEVHKTAPHIKALFVSGYPKESIELSSPGPLIKTYFLQKPFSLTELVAKIQEILKYN
ncbi:hybrid sensor histidine kinase/response regulator [Holospora curviuscula]|uniref:histidine kinase n=1 Tax=Holospora curviuscula TaxID=1082868 RepID=A0A2S5RHS8_9PROT|nr:ATP-binding protein [Holospora curviuscula]PPE06884.1 Blue-light-activated protein [Holospora curviuscula]